MMIIRFSLVLTALIWSTLTLAATTQPPFVAGKDYIVLANPVTTPGQGKVEVEEFFWYGCPHCYDLDKPLSQWVSQHQAQVQFEKMPVTFFGPASKLDAQAFYLLKSLKATKAISATKAESIHQALFKAKHREDAKLNNEKELKAFFQQQGISKQQFDDNFNSFSVKAWINESGKQTRRFAIMSVPTLIIAGKYKVNGETAGSMKRMLAVASYLVNKEKVSQAKASRDNNKESQPQA
jgi:thiol:disulfide interchange protein DsbA